MQRRTHIFSIPFFAFVLALLPKCAYSQSSYNWDELIGKLPEQKSIVTAIVKKIRQDSVKNVELQILAKSLNIDLSQSNEEKITIDLYNLIGAYYESISDYPSALKVLKKAIIMNQDRFPEKEIITCNYLGYVFWHQSKYDSAFFYHERSLNLARKNNLRNNDLAFTFLMLGNDYFDTGDYVKTSENYFECLKLYEALHDTIGQIMAHNRLCKMYYKLKDAKSARHHLSISRHLNRKVNYRRETAFSFNSLGNIQIEKNNLDSALFCFTETYRLYQSTGDIIGQSIASINLGDTYYAVYLKTKRALFSDSSFFYYKKSLDLNSKVTNKFGMIYGWWGMADNLLARSHAAEALNYYREALQTSKTINAKSEEANLYYKLFKIFEGHNTDSSYYYLKNYLSAKSLIENEERTKDLLRQESKYEIEKRVAEQTIKMEQQNLLNTEKIKWKNYALLGVVLISLILCYLVVISVKRMKIIANKTETINSINRALSSQHKEITDSINYARRIQNAILPSAKEFRKFFPESFILYKPKNIVAGDFYWLEKKGDTILFAVADCTGHGVPGAMVSVICNNGLNRSVREYGLTDPAEILNKTREIVIQEFEKSDDDVKDGMDISLVALAKAENENESESLSAFTLTWAGANNPLWIVRRTDAHQEKHPIIANEVKQSHNQTKLDSQTELVEVPNQTVIANEVKQSPGPTELIEVPPNKQPIGKHTESKPFTSHVIELKRGDCLYAFTDGFADQFGGPKGKKFKASNFKKLLLSIHHETMERQKELINESFENWRGNLEQVDDVCVIGVRV